MTCAANTKKCLDCRDFVEVRSHPSTDGKPVSAKRGNACVLFLEEGVVFDNWSPEGCCECWSPREIPPKNS